MVAIRIGFYDPTISLRYRILYKCNANHQSTIIVYIILINTVKV